MQDKDTTMIDLDRVAKSRIVRSLPLAGLVLLGGCGALDHGFFNAQGPVAADERHLFLVVSAVLLFVAGPVLLLTPVFAWHYRLSNKGDAYRPKWNFSWWVEGLIWIPPAGIVIGLAILLWQWTQVDDPYRKLPGQAPIEVEAIALDWKWLFIYPDQGIASINQLAIPVGRPVHIRLTSGTVMQSMQVPQLAGQIYAMAGMTTELNLAASRAGTYQGQNTQYNGKGFQQQKFAVLALSGADYQRWVTRVRAAPRSLEAAAWAPLSRQSVVSHPVFYGTVQPRFFDHVVASTGGAMHHIPKVAR